ncbi:MAG TPA: hypothetical protein VM692_12965 [Gammaproteobacteria bacterium]|nr:hypothetical protein [Gammaproteobacteria bacterium]
MRHVRYGLAAAALIGAPLAMAQLEVGGSALDNCSKIDALRKAGNYTEARDKAQACLDALEQEVTGSVGKLFSTNVAGWARANLQQDKVLGFTNVTATYKKGEHEATVALTGTGGGGGGGLGGLLGGFARAGLAGSGQQVRVGGLPASVQPDGTITVTLEDGSFLTFSSSSFTSQETALAGLGDLVNGFPVAEINKALQ